MVNTTPNWQPVDLAGKCGSCRHYRQRIIKDLETARGGCGIKGNLYKQRTETCKRYEEGRGDHEEKN